PHSPFPISPVPVHHNPEIPKDSPLRSIWNHFVGENKGTNQYISLINGPKAMYSEHELKEISYFWSADTAVNTADARIEILKTIENLPDSASKQTILSESQHVQDFAVKILESHIQDRESALALGLIVRAQIKAIGEYAQQLANHTLQNVNDTTEALKAIYKNSGFLKQIGHVVSDYFYNRKEAFTTFQRQALIDLAILYPLSIDISPEATWEKAQAGARVLQTILTVAPGMTPVAIASTESTIGLAKAVPDLGAAIAEGVNRGLAANENAVVQAEIAQIAAETKSILESAGEVINKLTPGKLRNYLGNADSFPRDTLVKDMESIGLQLKGKGSPDGKFMEFVDSHGRLRAKIHPPDEMTPTDHLHIYDKDGNSLNKALEAISRRNQDAHIPIQGK
ncbi:MAG: hypothetical protein ABI041_16930, partial [Bdellovibrionia bacterium]